MALDTLKSAQQSIASSTMVLQSSFSSSTKLPPKSPFVRPPIYTPGPVPFDPSTIHNWIYPQSPTYPARQYQHEITATAIQHNTLVSLPTGLGKTLIASVVMYNFYRWFPTGKVIFLAPTLPLVNQQVEACYRIMGIPASDTAVLTGKLSREKRMEHWMSRRVFYCTPQTLQNDLVETDSTIGGGDDGGTVATEIPSAFASQVVCLILDEAHKATGDYAYVKVIEQLEAASAKFRIVGLSATPGTTIKAIQNVIRILRSSRLEARDEDDPVVKRYTHEKHMEVVTVPRSTIQGDVERHITNMLSPFLTKLHHHGAINFKGNASVTAWQIINARNIFKSRNHGQVPGHLLSLYEAARVLATLRHDAHGSLQCLRSKLLPLQNEPQRGVVSTIVKSDEFKQLLQMVNEATDIDAGLSQQQGGFTRNNPKLQKLGDILTEHFRRATAAGKSSRVIVFSQFRDSVAEIVLLLRTLEPMVRPHHFVGQGKPPTGSSKDQDAGPTDMLRLNGMKQSEQQQVIQEFRDDRYNVLVCTCIGEEGLDIGEVDLIVNYDALKSPIRMIQRMGRTGRARAGRVIVLLAEGDEERAYAQSNANANKLKRALQTKKNLVMVPDILLFPVPPSERLDRDMNISTQLRMSQVAGVSDKATRRSNTSRTCKYKLDSAQEQERQQRLGNLIVLDTTATPWKTLRRVLIRHRSSRRSFGGRTVRILSAVQDTVGVAVDGSNAYKASRMNAAIYEIFPIERPPEVSTRGETASTGSSNASDPDDRRRVLHAQTDEKQQIPTEMTVEDSQHGLPPSTQLYKLSFPIIGKQPAEHTSPRTTPDHGNKGSVHPQSSPVAVSFEQAIPKHKHLNPISAQHTELVFDVAEALPEVSKPVDTVSVQQPVFRLPTPPPSSSEDESCDEEAEEDRIQDRVNSRNKGISRSDVNVESHFSSHVDGDFAPEHEHETAVSNASFCLPTQSSSSEGEDSSDDDETPKEKSPNVGQKPHCSSSASRKKYEPLTSTSAEAGLMTHSEIAEVHNYSEEDTPLISFRVRKKTREDPLISLRERVKSSSPSKRKRSSVVGGTGKNVSEDASLLRPERCLAPSNTASSKSPGVSFVKKKQKRLFIDEHEMTHPCLELQGLQKPIGSQYSAASPKSPTDILQDTQDTPNNSSQHEAMQGDIPVAHPKHAWAGPLTDTPLSAKAISHQGVSLVVADALHCEVCLSLESLNEDPIVLCDGCERGFHKSCYCIDASIESSEAWHCDQCKSPDTKITSSHSCRVCGINEGALKAQGDDGWCHPICKPFLSGGSLSQRQCSYCNAEGGSRCFSCPASIHPFCAVNAPHQQNWMVVTVQPHDMTRRQSAAIFCPNHVNNASNFISVHLQDGLAAPLAWVRVIQTREISRCRDLKYEGLKKLARKRWLRVDQPNSGSEKQHGIDEASIRRARLENLRQRRKGAAAFVLEEAEVGSDDVTDEDEDDDDELDDDEISNDSFINDAAELTQHFSQDELGLVDREASEDISFNHRALDAQREIAQQYKTPLLNRRMTRPHDSQFSSSSQKGLGNMHFVRSVLEHHRQGGRAEDIDAFYRQIEQDNMSHEFSSQRSPDHASQDEFVPTL
jgi:Fanconi anemia group M protein